MRLLLASAWAAAGAVVLAAAILAPLDRQIVWTAVPPAQPLAPPARAVGQTPWPQPELFVTVDRAPATAPAPPLPDIRLAGLVDGRNPAVLLDGVPGTNGTVMLGVGDSAGVVRLVEIVRGEAVVLRGTDTLRLRLTGGT